MIKKARTTVRAFSVYEYLIIVCTAMYIENINIIATIALFVVSLLIKSAANLSLSLYKFEKGFLFPIKIK